MNIRNMKKLAFTFLLFLSFSMMMAFNRKPPPPGEKGPGLPDVILPVNPYMVIFAIGLGIYYVKKNDDN